MKSKNKQKFTEKERHEIYRRALELYQEYAKAKNSHELVGLLGRGLCNVIIMAIGEIHEGLAIPEKWYNQETISSALSDLHILIEDNRFLEFILKRPPFRSINEFWWPINDTQKRVEVLKELIEETKPSEL